jgi:hypothetical protein
MVRDLAANPPVSWHYVAASPELPQGAVDHEFLAVRRQLAVAIGGAVRDVPIETTAVRLWPMAPPPQMNAPVERRGKMKLLEPPHKMPRE